MKTDRDQIDCMYVCECSQQGRARCVVCPQWRMSRPVR